MPVIDSYPNTSGPLLTTGDHQIIVLGRGMEPGGLEASSLTRQRALAASRYYELFEPSKVVFSTLASSQVSGSLRDRLSEAEAMAEIADLPSEVAVVETSSRSTVENFLYSAGLLDAELPTGVLAHRNHLPRAMMLGSKVLKRDLFGIPVEDLGLPSEGTSRSLIETVLRARDKAIMKGVQPGDIETIGRRLNLAQSIARGFRPAQPMVKFISNRFAQYN